MALVFQFRCNLRCETGLFADLSGGGGYDPAVIGFTDAKGEWVSNENQIWSLYSVPGNNSNIVVINNARTDRNIIADGPGRRVRCERGNETADEAHWYLEGGAIGSLKDESVVRFRNVKYDNYYLDAEGGGEADKTPFIIYTGHGGKNQAFKLWKRGAYRTLQG